MEKVTEEQCAFEKVPTYAEGKMFNVNPLAIDRSFFEMAKSNYKQESTRKLIIAAFAEVDKNPEKYSAPFTTMIPEKKWDKHKLVTEMEQYAKELGGHMADWVEQALEWAQRIFNGETWENICNNPDTAMCYRVVAWDDGFWRLVGGSRAVNDCCPASYVYDRIFGPFVGFRSTVPLVVFKKE